MLKSGCRAEDAKLRTAERLTNLITVFCLISWRVFWLTMVHRTNPKTPADAVSTEAELAILNHVSGAANESPPKSVAHYLIVIAKLGGYLARKNDGPPGNTVMWRGLSRLTDIHLGVEIGKGFVGNGKVDGGDTELVGDAGRFVARLARRQTAAVDRDGDRHCRVESTGLSHCYRRAYPRGDTPHPRLGVGLGVRENPEGDAAEVAVDRRYAHRSHGDDLVETIFTSGRSHLRRNSRADRQGTSHAHLLRGRAWRPATCASLPGLPIYALALRRAAASSQESAVCPSGAPPTAPSPCC